MGTVRKGNLTRSSTDATRWTKRTSQVFFLYGLCLVLGVSPLLLFHALLLFFPIPKDQIWAYRVMYQSKSRIRFTSASNPLSSKHWTTLIWKMNSSNCTDKDRETSKWFSAQWAIMTRSPAAVTGAEAMPFGVFHSSSLKSKHNLSKTDRIS